MAWTKKTWTDYSGPPWLEAAELQRHEDAVDDHQNRLASLEGGAHEVSFSVSSTLVTGAGQLRFYPRAACSVTGVRVFVGTAPTGSSVIVDVNKNGTTIYGTQTQRPTIAAGTNFVRGGTISNGSLTTSDYLTVDVDQIGSTVAGANLTVVVEHT